MQKCEVKSLILLADIQVTSHFTDFQSLTPTVERAKKLNYMRIRKKLTIDLNLILNHQENILIIIKIYQSTAELTCRCKFIQSAYERHIITQSRRLTIQKGFYKKTTKVLIQQVFILSVFYTFYSILSVLYISFCKLYYQYVIKPGFYISIQSVF